MDKLTEQLPEIIAAAAQSHLGILALLSVALSFLAYFFFAGASEKVKVGIFVLLFLGVVGFGAAMFRAAATSPQPSPNSAASLSKEAKLLLKEATSDSSGTIMFIHHGLGVNLETNDKNLITDQSRRAVAVWESALQELLDAHLIVQRDHNGEVFTVTKKGNDVAEHLPN